MASKYYVSKYQKEFGICKEDYKKKQKEEYDKMDTSFDGGGGGGAAHVDSCVYVFDANFLLHRYTKARGLYNVKVPETVPLSVYRYFLLIKRDIIKIVNGSHCLISKIVPANASFVLAFDNENSTLRFIDKSYDHKSGFTKVYDLETDSLELDKSLFAFMIDQLLEHLSLQQDNNKDTDLDNKETEGYHDFLLFLKPDSAETPRSTNEILSKLELWFMKRLTYEEDNIINEALNDPDIVLFLKGKNTKIRLPFVLDEVYTRMMFGNSVPYFLGLALSSIQADVVPAVFKAKNDNIITVFNDCDGGLLTLSCCSIQDADKLVYIRTLKNNDYYYYGNLLNFLKNVLLFSIFPSDNFCGIGKDKYEEMDKWIKKNEDEITNVETTEKAKAVIDGFTRACFGISEGNHWYLGFWRLVHLTIGANQKLINVIQPHHYGYLLLQSIRENAPKYVKLEDFEEAGYKDAEECVIIHPKMNTGLKHPSAFTATESSLSSFSSNIGSIIEVILLPGETIQIPKGVKLSFPFIGNNFCMERCMVHNFKNDSEWLQSITFKMETPLHYTVLRYCDNIPYARISHAMEKNKCVVQVNNDFEVIRHTSYHFPVIYSNESPDDPQKQVYKNGIYSTTISEYGQINQLTTLKPNKARKILQAANAITLDGQHRRKTTRGNMYDVSMLPSEPPPNLIAKVPLSFVACRQYQDTKYRKYVTKSTAKRATSFRKIQSTADTTAVGTMVYDNGNDDTEFIIGTFEAQKELRHLVLEFLRVCEEEDFYKYKSEKTSAEAKKADGVIGRFLWTKKAMIEPLPAELEPIRQNIQNLKPKMYKDAHKNIIQQVMGSARKSKCLTDVDISAQFALFYSNVRVPNPKPVKIGFSHPPTKEDGSFSVSLNADVWTPVGKKENGQTVNGDKTLSFTFNSSHSKNKMWRLLQSAMAKKTPTSSKEIRIKVTTRDNGNVGVEVHIPFESDREDVLYLIEHILGCDLGIIQPLVVSDGTTVTKTNNFNHFLLAIATRYDIGFRFIQSIYDRLFPKPKKDKDEDNENEIEVEVDDPVIESHVIAAVCSLPLCNRVGRTSSHRKNKKKRKHVGYYRLEKKLNAFQEKLSVLLKYEKELADQPEKWAKKAKELFPNYEQVKTTHFENIIKVEDIGKAVKEKLMNKLDFYKWKRKNMSRETRRWMGKQMIVLTIFGIPPESEEIRNSKRYIITKYNEYKNKIEGASSQVEPPLKVNLLSLGRLSALTKRETKRKTVLFKSRVLGKKLANYVESLYSRLRLPILFISEAYSSSLCHKCLSFGIKNNAREFICETCGIMDRDENAAHVIYRFGVMELIETLREHYYRTEALKLVENYVNNEAIVSTIAEDIKKDIVEGITKGIEEAITEDIKKDIEEAITEGITKDVCDPYIAKIILWYQDKIVNHFTSCCWNEEEELKVLKFDEQTVDTLLKEIASEIVTNIATKKCISNNETDQKTHATEERKRNTKKLMEFADQLFQLTIID